jgi:PAS domain-containing protein
MDSKSYAESILKTLREPLLVLDGNHRVRAASPSFYSRFQVTEEQTVGRSIYDLGRRQWDVPALRMLLSELLPRNGEFNDFLVESNFPNLGRRIMLLNARQLRDDGQTGLILLAIEDITDRRRAELEAERQRIWFETTLYSIGDAVIATDADAYITFLNPTAEKMTGWRQTEAEGHPLDPGFSDLEAKASYRHRWHVLKHALRK